MEAASAYRGFFLQSRLISRALPLILLLITFGILLSTARAETVVAQRGSSLQFPRPASIEPNIKFWVDVFSSYSERDFIVHDKDDVTKIYQVLHIPGDGSPTKDDVQWANTYLKTKYSDMLNRLAEGHPPATFEEQRVANMFKGERNPNYVAAAQNLRVQQGMAERFRETLVRARLYLPRIQEVFRSFGLPEQLALLPTVESGFHRYACSKAGAMGIWQFTRSTGKEYMTVSGRQDDRLDPAKATEAAAQLLLHNHDLLGSWPLAITAYNYGTGGMMQAVDATGGGDYCEILRRFDGPHFGFASKNYYPEFLAAVQVYQYRDAYFPGIDEEVPDYAEETPPPRVYHVHYASRRHYSRYGVRRVSASGRGRHHLRHAIYRSRSHRHLRSA
jgi:membrane-bound lytic murein transglycosylase D